MAANTDGNEMSGPVQPGLRAIDAINPDDPGIRMAARRRRHHGQHHARLRQRHRRPDASTSSSAAAPSRRCGSWALADGNVILGGLKLANGENPKGYGKNKQQAPFTRMKVAALQREQFVKAKRVQGEARRRRRRSRPRPRLEPLVEVLEAEAHRSLPLPPRRRHDDRRPPREEFGFETRAAARHRGLPRRRRPGEEEDPGVAHARRQPRRQARGDGPARRERRDPDKAGVKVAINTDDSITESRFFLRTGAIAVRGGMSEMAAAARR